MYDEKSESKDFANVPAADSSPPPLATPSNENIETLNPGPMEGLHKKCQGPNLYFLFNLNKIIN